MFHSDRTCYGLRGRDLAGAASAIRSAGGRPYFVARPGDPWRPKHRNALFESATGRAIFEVD
jgi:hypothetical protein